MSSVLKNPGWELKPRGFFLQNQSCKLKKFSCHFFPILWVFIYFTSFIFHIVEIMFHSLYNIISIISIYYMIFASTFLQSHFFLFKITVISPKVYKKDKAASWNHTHWMESILHWATAISSSDSWTERRVFRKSVEWLIGQSCPYHTVTGVMVRAG